MKFKIGDKVKIREDLVVDLAYGCDEFVSDMSEYCGKEATITGIYDNCLVDGVYFLDIDDGTWYWTDEMLEALPNIKKNHVILNLSDELTITIQQGNKKITITKGNIKFEELNEFQKELTKILRGQSDITHLSEDEKAILKSIDKCFRYIARSNGTLMIYGDKPKKVTYEYEDEQNNKDYWIAWMPKLGCIGSLRPFNHLFSFIKNEDTEPYGIDDLLKQNVAKR